MKKKKLITTLAIMLVLSGCAPVLDNNNNSLGTSNGSSSGLSADNSTPPISDTNKSENSTEPMLLAIIPQEFNFRNQKYKMVTSEFLELQDVQLDSIIAYLINAKDYDTFYAENQEVEYCVDETNTLYYAYGQIKFPIFSLIDHDTETLIALLFPDGSGSPDLFLNVNSYK